MQSLISLRHFRMSAKMNVPKLRFCEFSGEWEERKLGEITNKVMYGMNSSAIAFDGENKYLRITDIDETSRTFLPNPLTSPDGEIEEKYKLKDGDIVFTRTGASVGKSYLYKIKDGNLLFAGFLIKFSIIKGDPYFIFSQTLKTSYDKWVQKMSMRSGQPGLNAEEYKELSIIFPSILEQQKIASFLSSVDTKIEQLTKKKTLLEEYKKGVMQKIFAQEIRFRDDDGSEYPEWVEKKLGEIATFLKGKSISKSDIVENGNLECIRYGELYTLYNEQILEIKSKTNLNKDNLVLSKYNDIIIPASGETQIDIATASCVLKDGVALGGDLNIIRTKENGVYLSYYLNSSKKIEIAKMAQGNAVVHLYSSQLKELKTYIPSLKEQTKIANFLSSLDSKLLHVEKQLSSTKQFKKALLQQMFV